MQEKVGFWSTTPKLGWPTRSDPSLSIWAPTKTSRGTTQKTWEANTWSPRSWGPALVGWFDWASKLLGAPPLRTILRGWPSKKWTKRTFPSTEDRLATFSTKSEYWRSDWNWIQYYVILYASTFVAKETQGFKTIYCSHVSVKLGETRTSFSTLNNAAFILVPDSILNVIDLSVPDMPCRPSTTPAWFDLRMSSTQSSTST